MSEVHEFVISLSFSVVQRERVQYLIDKARIYLKIEEGYLAVVVDFLHSAHEDKIAWLALLRHVVVVLGDVVGLSFVLVSHLLNYLSSMKGELPSYSENRTKNISKAMKSLD